MKIIKKIKNKFLGLNNKTSRYILRLQRAYRINSFNKKDKKVLEICGGQNPLSRDNINIDVLDHPLVDIVFNIQNELPFKDGEIDEIVSIATLEHFNLNDLKKILGSFYQVLKRGGVLNIGVPSLHKIFEYWKHNGCDDLVVRYLHGAQKDEYDLHLSILDFKRYKKEMINVGFINVVELEYKYPYHDSRFMMRIRAEKL